MKSNPIGFLLLILSTSPSLSQPGWHPLNTSGIWYVYDISFPNENTGYVAGVGSENVKKTTDGGATWQGVSTDADNWYGIMFVDPERGCAAGQHDIGAGGVYPTIHCTSDGGATWWGSQRPPGCQYCGYSDISFWDSLNGIATGPMSLRTTDGGMTWTVCDSVYAGGVSLVNPGIATTVSSTIRRTMDAGETWITQHTDPAVLNGVSFADSLIGIAVGYSGTVLSTTDGGESWVRQSSRTNLTLWDVFMVDSLRATAVGDSGTIVLTTDGGVTWGHQTSGTTYNLYAVTFVNASLGFCVGEGGTILRTFDGGGPVSVEEEAGAGVPMGYTLTQNYPNPFNGISNFEMRISNLGHVTLKIFDLLGRGVATIVNEKLSPGSYTRQWDATGVASGVYLYRLTAGDFVQTRKLVLIR